MGVSGNHIGDCHNHLYPVALSASIFEFPADISHSPCPKLHSYLAYSLLPQICFFFSVSYFNNWYYTLKTWESSCLPSPLCLTFSHLVLSILHNIYVIHLLLYIPTANLHSTHYHLPPPPWGPPPLGLLAFFPLFISDQRDYFKHTTSIIKNYLTKCSLCCMNTSLAPTWCQCSCSAQLYAHASTPSQVHVGDFQPRCILSSSLKGPQPAWASCQPCYWLTHTPIIGFPTSLFSVSCSLPWLPGITSQINYLHPSSCPGPAFGGIQTKTASNVFLAVLGWSPKCLMWPTNCCIIWLSHCSRQVHFYRPFSFLHSTWYIKLFSTFLPWCQFHEGCLSHHCLSSAWQGTYCTT